MEVQAVFDRIRRCMESEDRKDVEFRALIALTELGDIVKYITHDLVLNPGARPHGTPEDEKLAYGQALVQTIATMLLREVDIEEALEAGLKNWEEADWRRREAKQQQEGVKGRTAYAGTVSGVAYVVSSEHPLREMPQGNILVVSFASPDTMQFASRMVAIVTDHGGVTSHAAIIARERGIPCIVGTGNATQKIPHGARVLVKVGQDEGTVEILEEMKS